MSDKIIVQGGIPIEDDGDASLPPQGGFETGAGEKNEPRIRIILEENDDIPPTGQFIGVNGMGYILRPGEPADVPISVIGVLDAAITSVPTVDPGTRQVVGYRERLRFPYRRVA